jgi:hypothetical protein
MWAFWSKRVRTARARAAFSEFVSAEGLSRIEDSLKSTSTELVSLNKETISYVIFQVRDDEPEDIQRHLGHVLDIVLDHDGTIESIMSSIAVATFKSRAPAKRSLDVLLGKLGPDVRAIYGQGEFLRGTHGSLRRFTYGTIFPNINAKLEALRDTEFGATTLCPSS